MKKQFFYAALAIGMMSSCLNNDLPGNQEPEKPLDNEGKVAIELGIQSPNATLTASTRSVGAVGGTKDETNLWNGQQLYVLAFDKNTVTPAVDSITLAPIFNGLTFKAPTQTWNSGENKVEGGSTIKILKDPTTIQAVYYNPAGNMDFFGYHVDDLANTYPDDVQVATVEENRVIKVVGLKIDGAQDLLGAKTKEVNDTNYPAPVAPESINQFNTAVNPERGFSAWAARRGIQPILSFQHLLTRFTFTVEAATKDAAEWYWDGDSSTFIENKTNESPSVTAAVQIESIIIKGIQNEVEIVLNNDSEGAPTAPYAQVKAGSGTDDFELQGRNATGLSEDLTPTAAKVFENQGADNSSSWISSNGTYSTKTPVGESLMIPAGSSTVTIEVKLKQRVIDTENEANGDPIDWIDKTGTITKVLDFNRVNGGTNSGTGFNAGKSYAVNIKVYSFQRIEITAELEKWGDGGSLEVEAE